MVKGLTFDQYIKSIEDMVKYILDGYEFERFDHFTFSAMHDAITYFFDDLSDRYLDNVDIEQMDFLKWNLYNKYDRNIYYEFFIECIYEKNGISPMFNKMSITERYGLI